MIKIVFANISMRLVQLLPCLRGPMVPAYAHSNDAVGDQHQSSFTSMREDNTVNIYASVSAFQRALVS